MNGSDSWANLRVLTVAPHPDDEVIGVGGTISRAIREGAQVNVVIGSWRDEQRWDEARQASLALGGPRLIRLFQGPVDLVPEREVVGELERIIDDVRPHVVLLPENAVHPEHRLWFRAGLAATRPSAGSRRWRPAHVWCWEAPADDWGGPVNTSAFVEIDESDLERKLSALGEHKSQSRTYPSERSEGALRALAMLRGSQAGVPYAEAYRVLRDLW